MIRREEVSKPQGSAYIRKRIEIKRKFFGISSITTSGREYLRIDGRNWKKNVVKCVEKHHRIHWEGYDVDDTYTDVDYPVDKEL